jgi:threonine aldolase
VVSITQSTELGTLYSADEIAALAETAHAHDLLLHVDGARIANAVAALGQAQLDVLESLPRQLGAARSMSRYYARDEVSR